MITSVILTTYNSPDWLEKSLIGFASQTSRQFEIVVADDGSSSETARLVRKIASETGIPIQHIWHEDLGFRKSTIVNRAIEAAAGDYLIFSDGDCIPHSDFIAQHLRFAAPHRFLSGGMVRLPRDLSHRITAADIRSGKVHQSAWLAKQGMKLGPKLKVLLGFRRAAILFDLATTTRPTFNGHNSSAWKSDVVRVNGLDERMEYGGLDRELGERLVNSGVRPLQIRHRAICVHLDHDRAYIRPECLLKNAEIRNETRTLKLIWTPFGIVQTNHEVPGQKAA